MFTLAQTESAHKSQVERSMSPCPTESPKRKSRDHDPLQQRKPSDARPITQADIRHRTEAEELKLQIAKQEGRYTGALEQLQGSGYPSERPVSD